MTDPTKADGQTLFRVTGEWIASSAGVPGIPEWHREGVHAVTIAASSRDDAARDGHERIHRIVYHTLTENMRANNEPALAESLQVTVEVQAEDIPSAKNISEAPVATDS